jgi:heme ABC exporter ATP-binding subunit CcmA
MTGTALEIQGVWKFFGEFAAVRDVSLDVPQGRILALLGRNGAGKTTLLRMMAGLLRPSRGKIETHGQDDATLQTKAVVGMVGHGLWLYEDLTAQENLAFFARLYNVTDAAGKIDHWLEATALAPFRNSRLSEFSRGMRQRLAIARAFLHDPPILLLDEPWTALDDRAIDLLSSLLTGAQQQQRTALVCSHQLTETLQLATHLLVLDRGRLAFSGENNDQLRTAPQNFYQRVL